MPWQDFFPYTEPYPYQDQAIDEAIDSIENNGYYTLEAACGTGKSISALTASLHHIRQENTLPSRAVIVTSVKNQLEQFIAELEQINTQTDLTPPVKAIALVGRRDLHPYLRENVIADLESQETIADLRERSIELINRGSDIYQALNGRPDPEAEDWYDAAYASELRSRVTQMVETIDVRDAASQTTRTELTSLTTGGVETPYPTTPPLVEDVIEADIQIPDRLQGPFDPFLIGYYACKDEALPISFTDPEAGVVTKDELLQAAGQAGVDPHLVMADLGADAEVIIGNYNHVFDTQTRLLTQLKMGILDQETILVVDEAHNVEEKARGLFSDSLSEQSLRTARNDVTGALQLLREGHVSDLGAFIDLPDTTENRTSNPRQIVANQLLDQYPITEEWVEALYELLDWLIETAFPQLAETAQDEHTGRTGDGSTSRGPADDPLKIDLSNLRTPQSEEDRVSELIRERFDRITPSDSGTDRLTRIRQAADLVVTIWNELGERQTQVQYVVAVIIKWLTVDQIRYYRELEVDSSTNALSSQSSNVRLRLRNTIPADDLAEIFNELYGGILMSATLEPHDVFHEVTGLDQITDRHPLQTATYPIPFPKSNRVGLITPLPSFTYRNRGSTTIRESEMTETRRKYAHTLRGLANTHGNILIGMPSYAEAEWSASLLRQLNDLDKPVYLDQSSGYEETQALLDEFWEGDHSILCTSLRGTITEGVDYPGDKLHTVVVVGVPLANTQDPYLQAVEAAYEDQYGEDNGFTYAFKIPAIRKARQAIGRVIRSPTDIGVRIFLDRRYAPRGRYSVHQWLSEQEQAEFHPARDPVESVNMFWNKHSIE